MRYFISLTNPGDADFLMLDHWRALAHQTGENTYKIMGGDIFPMLRFLIGKGVNFTLEVKR